MIFTAMSLLPKTPFWILNRIAYPDLMDRLDGPLSNRMKNEIKLERS